MQTKTSRDETQESITACISEYRKLLLRERQSLKQQLNDAGDLLDAEPVQKRLTEVESELAQLKAESVLQPGDIIS